MNDFVLKIGADKERKIYYMDTDSFYINIKDFEPLKHIKDCLGGGKNDYSANQAIIYGRFVGSK